MTIENIFIEFMSLYYNSSGSKSATLKDIPIEPGIIARCSDLGCTIYYLTTGTYIRIPWEMMDLFSSLDSYSGHRILSLEPKNDIEKFIFNSLYLINSINTRKGDIIISALSNVVDIGTLHFREWYTNRFNKKILAIECFSPDKNFEI